MIQEQNEEYDENNNEKNPFGLMVQQSAVLTKDLSKGTPSSMDPDANYTRAIQELLKK